MPIDPTMQQWIQGEWNAGRLTRPAAVIQALVAAPEAFLRKHPLLNTFDCPAHGTTNAYLRNDRADAKRPGSRLGTLNFHKTESFNVEMISALNAYGVSFPVHGVYTSPSSGGPLWYTLDNTGPNIMLTAKLTGCTFVATAGGANTVDVTHLQPHQESGLQLNQRMRGAGQAAYGRLKYDFDTRSVNVVGVRVGTAWQIFAQKLEKNSATPKILSVNRIWPL